MHLQSHLSSLTLVRLLREWAPTPGEPARQDVAERLGEWLSAFDSVKLDGALQAIASYGAASQPASARQRGQVAAVDAPALEALCQRVKADLTGLIAAQVAAVVEPDYGLHHRRYAALQKQMETQMGACRAHVRQALSKGSPRLRQLSALDGVMVEMLGDREQKLMSAVPVYLERRFTHWREAGVADDEKGAWLHGFRQDMRQMLLAELHVRLQPVLGLIEAVQEDNRQRFTHQA
jgi:hypothetical protein